MSEMAERTEEATPRKREEAHEEGKIPKSQDLTTALVLLGSALIINNLGPKLASAVTSLAAYSFMVASGSSLDGAGAVTMIRTIGWKLLAAMLSFMLAMSGVSLAISAAQARGVLSTKPLGPNWGRLDPMANFKNMFGKQSLVELVKSLLKMGVIGFAVYGALSASWSDSIALAQQSPRQLATVMHIYTVQLITNTGLAYLALAAADYLYQIWEHQKSLRMSKQEVKEESRQSEGDPMVKARMRAIGRSLARRQMFQDVPLADVVVTNPTHIAVALKYDPAKADAPVVIAMGQRKIAERIKAIAKAEGVPTIENKPLARALLASARVGMTIPPDLYVAVAEVLAFIFSQKRDRRWQRGGAA